MLSHSSTSDESVHGSQPEVFPDTTQPQEPSAVSPPEIYEEKRSLFSWELEQLLEEAREQGYLAGIAEKMIAGWVERTALNTLNLHELTEAALKIYRELPPVEGAIEPPGESDYQLIRGWAFNTDKDPQNLAKSLRYHRQLEASGRRNAEAEKARLEAKRLDEAERAINLKILEEDLRAWAAERPADDDPDAEGHPYGFERGYLGLDDVRLLLGEETLPPHLARWRLMRFIFGLIDIEQNVGNLDDVVFSVADVAAYHHGIGMEECRKITDQVFEYCLRSPETCEHCDRRGNWRYHPLPREGCPPELAHLLGTGAPKQGKRKRKASEKIAAIQARADAEWGAD